MATGFIGWCRELQCQVAPPGQGVYKVSGDCDAAIRRWKQRNFERQHDRGVTEYTVDNVQVNYK